MHPDDATLNGYVDAELDAGARADVERHLESCGECRAAVDDLRELRRLAGALAPMEPPARAWNRIESRLRDARPQTGSRRTTYAWLAAAAALLVATGIGLRLGPLAPSKPAITSQADRLELAQSVESELRAAEQHYQKAIAGLEQITNAEKGSLDPQTAATLEKNLAVIDQAISESRAALKAQPNSEPAQESLLDSFKTKIALLQDTVALINEMRKGNDAGAARIVSGAKQKGA